MSLPDPFKPAVILCARCYRVMGRDGKPLDWGRYSRSLRLEVLEITSEEEASAAINKHGWTGTPRTCICPACKWYSEFLEEKSKLLDSQESKGLMEQFQ